ncbi:DUF262 domain-containing protein [Alloscardovia omnicolens]|nr:DUF262 domain-containing protein [Alloscardovia omnicolens]
MVRQAQYRYDNLPVVDIDKIILPKYQRGFVWTTKKKEDFIETLHAGFPFGTFLVYEDRIQDSEKRYVLVDGQQRLSTLRQYNDDRVGYWKKLNKQKFDIYYQQVIDIIENDSFKEIDFLNALKHSEPTAEIMTRIDDSDEKRIKRIFSKMSVLREICTEIREETDTYVDLEHLKLPVIVFEGDKRDLPNVFANLNKGGAPLNKYEIWGAAWANVRIILDRTDSNSAKLLNLVRNYYDDKQNQSEFDIEGFSADELFNTGEINLSELGMALGKLVQSELPALVGSSESDANEIGFGILGIATNTHNKDLNRLAEENNVRKIQSELPDILQKSISICDSLQKAFSKLLGIEKTKKDSEKGQKDSEKPNKNSEYANGLNATYKTLSYFAALWDLRPDTQPYADTMTNIPAYYVYHSLTREWGAHGDQTLYKYYPGEKTIKNDYLKPLDQGRLLSELDKWIDESEVGIMFSRDVKAIVTMHANLTYLAAKVHHGESYELEHIIAKKHINEAETNTNNRQIKGGALGNCMWLMRTKNNRKKDKNFYELQDSGIVLSPEFIEESRYPAIEDFSQIEYFLAQHMYDEVNEHIDRRGHEVVEDLVEALYKDF